MQDGGFLTAKRADGPAQKPGSCIQYVNTGKKQTQERVAGASCPPLSLCNEEKGRGHLALPFFDLD
jgi:hypothetical protein